MTVEYRNRGGASQFLDDLNGAMRDNPVAAGLIGMGVLWMFLGGNRIAAIGGTVPRAARSTTHALGAAAGAGARAVHHGASAASSTLSATAGQVRSGAARAADAVGDAVQWGQEAVRGSSDYYAEASAASPSEGWSAERVTSSAQGYARNAQQRLSSAFDRQPLLLGAVGLAIGAGIAAAFRPTETERALMGQAGAELKDKAQAVAKDAVELAKTRTSKALEAMAQEAEAQGLTAAAAKDDLRSRAEAVKNVAKASWNP
jgi:hypothetical protein